MPIEKGPDGKSEIHYTVIYKLFARWADDGSLKKAFIAGMKPNIAENPRNRKKTKRGRKRFVDDVLYAVRSTIERVFAWEDKFKRLLQCSSRTFANKVFLLQKV